jgi:predicted PurR-regulated permease PerM
MDWKSKINKKYMQISLYVIITVLIIYTLSLVLKNAPMILHEIMVKISWFINVIKPVILGFVFAYLMNPVVDHFEQKFLKLKEKKPFKRMKRPRTWAAFSSVMLLVIAISGLISLIVFTVTDQLRLANLNDIINLMTAYINNFTDFIRSIQNRLNDLNIESGEFNQYLSNASNYILNLLKGFANFTKTSITNFSSYLTTFIFSFIIGFYFMIDGRMFINYSKKILIALFSERMNKRIAGITHDLNQVFSGYVRGQLTDAFVMMILISITLSITGVKFAIVIGVFAGIGNLIPYFGPIVAYVSTIIICLINGDIKTLIISVIALFVIQAVDGNFIGPKLLSQSIQIHPLIIIVSLIFGSALGGFMGMLLAVPVGAYLKLVFVRFIEHRLKHKEDSKHTI